MKLDGYAPVFLVLAGVAGIGVQSGFEGPGPSPRPGTLVRGSIAGDTVTSKQDTVIREADTLPNRATSSRPDTLAETRLEREKSIEPAQEAPSTRRSWRNRRNRYPGPIPTPADWEPPEGPVRIGLQVGHWKTEEAPRELSGLRRNGTRWQDHAEWEVNLAIAQATAELLKEEGYEVDLLPAVVPPGYRAHLFISIHADGSNDSRATGFRVAAPRRDATGRASDFVGLLEESYGKETGLRNLPDVTRRMRNYYAFNFRRYEHALHPMTIAVILETGFLTSPRDRAVILDDPERAARGILEAVKAYEVTPPPTKNRAPHPGW